MATQFESDYAPIGAASYRLQYRTDDTSAWKYHDDGYEYESLAVAREHNAQFLRDAMNNKGEVRIVKIERSLV